MADTAVLDRVAEPTPLPGAAALEATARGSAVAAAADHRRLPGVPRGLAGRAGRQERLRRRLHRHPRHPRRPRHPSRAAASPSWIAIISVAINTVFGVDISILLVRYDFPGKRAPQRRCSTCRCRCRRSSSAWRWCSSTAGATAGSARRSRTHGFQRHLRHAGHGAGHRVRRRCRW